MTNKAFLPVFFTALAIVFGIAVWMRLSAYSETATLQPGAAPVVAAAPVVPAEETAPEPPSDPGVIVEAGQTTESSPRSTREQRYKELLRAGPPGETQAASEPKNESLFDRVVNPIASAFGIQRTKPPATVAAAPPPAPRSANQAPQAQPPEEPAGAAEETRPREPREDRDAETDVTPPQLVAVEFTPPQVQDDGETMLAAIVTDNLSGVRSVSGVIASPSGALQGFACQREGQTDRYVARIKIPRDAAEGTWTVKYLTLTDNANNSVNLNQAAGALPPTAAFRVVSAASDSTAPVLRSVYLERRAMAAGERNTVFVQADDDKSGLSLVSGVFVSPSKQARIGFGCRPGAGGAWECVVAPPACLDCGVWQLEQVQVQDKANNMATFRGDNQLVQQVALEISGDKCDAGPPVITSLSLQPDVVSNAEGGTVHVHAIMADDACGVASLSGQAVPSGAQGAQRIYFSFDPSPDGQNFFGRILVPKHAAKGSWGIGWIQALDKGHNLKAYSSNDPILSRVTFRVE